MAYENIKKDRIVTLLHGKRNYEKKKMRLCEKKGKKRQFFILFIFFPDNITRLFYIFFYDLRIRTEVSSSNTAGCRAKQTSNI